MPSESLMDTEKLLRKRVGEIPLLLHMAKRLNFEQVLESYLPSHGNEKVRASHTLLLLIFNLTSGRQPLYELSEWVSQIDARLLGENGPLCTSLFNDDRFGRALDKLYELDRASLMTDLVLNVVGALDLDLSQIHNDSTSIKTYGQMPSKARSGLQFARGHSKDHRPDLKQIVFSLSLSADGAVPIHCKSYPGNTTDDTTHIETWKQLRQIAGRADFLYVADCKVCTAKQLSFITKHGGRIVTLMPDTWREAEAFKQQLRRGNVHKRRILRQLVPGQDDTFESFYCFNGQHVTEKCGYTLYWIYTTEKRKRDRLAREQRLERFERDMAELTGKLNSHVLKTADQIQERIDKLVKKHRVNDLYHLQIRTVNESARVQIGKGRLGKDTRYKMSVRKIYTLAWSRNKSAMDEQMRTDGIFPILCTDKRIGAKKALLAYKYQPRLEKRFEQLKSVHNAAPTLCKKTERVEAMMFLFFMALILQAAIEREVRQSMKHGDIDSIPVYPEHRLAEHPTTAKIFDRFHDLSLYQLTDGGRLIKEYQDELSSTHKKVLALMGMNEQQYWAKTC